jgi:hypothetical protein
VWLVLGPQGAAWGFAALLPFILPCAIAGGVCAGRSLQPASHELAHHDQLRARQQLVDSDRAHLHAYSRERSAAPAPLRCIPPPDCLELWRTADTTSPSIEGSYSSRELALREISVAQSVQIVLVDEITPKVIGAQCMKLSVCGREVA